MSPQYTPPQLEQPQSQPTGELLNTGSTPQMPTDKTTASLAMAPNQAMTNLGFATNMLHHLIEYKGKGKTAPEGPKTAPQQEETTEPNDTPQEETQESDPTIELQGKINELEIAHKKEVDFLESKIVSQIKEKGDYDTKLKDLEVKHQAEMDAIKQEIKTILHG